MEIQTVQWSHVLNGPNASQVFLLGLGIRIHAINSICHGPFLVIIFYCWSIIPCGRRKRGIEQVHRVRYKQEYLLLGISFSLSFFSSFQKVLGREKYLVLIYIIQASDGYNHTNNGSQVRKQCQQVLFILNQFKQVPTQCHLQFKYEKKKSDNYLLKS